MKDKTDIARHLVEVPVLRIHLSTPARIIRFYKHLKGCKDGMCLFLLFNVELPLFIRWGFLMLAGYEVQQKAYLVSALSVLLFITFTKWAYGTGRAAHLFAEDVARNEVMGMVQEMFKKGGGPMGMALPFDQLFKAMGNMGGEPADPIDRLIKESNDLYNKNKDDGGKPPVS